MTIKDQAEQRRGADAAPGARWRLDTERSDIGFGVRKMGLYTVKGRFRATEGDLTLDGAGHPVSADVTLDAASVSTRMPPRDAHLRSGHFLGVKEHPAIRLHADRIAADDDGDFDILANTAIKGATRRIELRGHEHDDGDRKVVHVSGRLDRHAFGIRPPMMFEWVVGRHVDVQATLVFVR